MISLGSSWCVVALSSPLLLSSRALIFADPLSLSCSASFHTQSRDYFGYRKIRGDGNCYYRAAVVGFFEQGLEEATLNAPAGLALEARSAFMTQAATRLASVSDAVAREYSASASDQHAKLVSWVGSCTDWDSFDSALQADASFDQVSHSLHFL